MRRGHLGIGGWRNENPRHFGPRSGGSSYFRHNRPYSLLETPRYPTPGPQPPPNFNAALSSDNHNEVPDRHYSNIYRHLNNYAQHRPSDRGYHNFSRGQQQQNIGNQHDRGHYQNRGHHQSDSGLQHQGRDHRHPQRKNFPFFQNVREGDVIDHSIPPYYDEEQKRDPFHGNSIGDIDHRLTNNNQENRHNISPWINPPNELRQYYEDRNNHNNSQRHPEINMENKMMLQTGHRPHSSDYYGSNSAPIIENTSFNRSVDDTVDIVRKRLLNRSDSQNVLIQSTDENTNENKNLGESDHYEHIQQQPTKKRQQRQKQNTKENCHKIKNKIIHQLFKMDKGKIHKLMDNPNSSTKFEYAISSLITESQNSLNHHLRSVAEKSLSGSDFIQNDNNTIYEDTFMKQMQCILDPQDTVLLEDIKPMVMAELTKVLQLDEFEHRFDIDSSMSNLCSPSQARDENINYNPYFNETQNYEDEFLESPIFDGMSSPHYEKSIPEGNRESNGSYEVHQIDPQPLFQRRTTRESCDYSHNRIPSTESQQQTRRSRDSKTEEELSAKSPMPLFDSNTEQFSEDEDPFAEFDQQYHVEVDHNFLENEDTVSPQQLFSNRPKSPVTKIENPSDLLIQSPVTNDSVVKQEIDAQLQNVAKSPLKLNLQFSKSKTYVSNIKQEQTECFNLPKNQTSILPRDNANNNVIENINLKQEPISEPKENNEIVKSENSTSITKSAVPSNSRKRSNDQRPSHRKEKRKKNENPLSDKQILNKNIIINVNDCAAKADKCPDSAKSIFNLFFSKDEVNKNISSKEDKTGDVTDKAYSDKYVKRKETKKKTKDRNSQSKNRTSSSSSHSMLSPKENTTNNNNVTPSKSDAKTKLKPINMFEEQPRKLNVHTSHRNTASTPVVKKKTDIENISKQVLSVARKVTKRHVSTQVMKKLQTTDTQTVQSISSCTRYCQTETKKLLTKSVQTDTVRFKECNFKSTDTFERMKEIDLEIQVLLQEKFKLYSSLESKESSLNTMHTLGMTVLNVTPAESTKEDEVSTEILSEDTIVEEFTNIPVGELEQIALETVQEEDHETITEKKRQTKQLQERERNTETSTTKRKKKKPNKIKTPNISILEQIIKDDRPLEDIISLDDLENLPTTTKKKSQKTPKTPKRKVKKCTKTQNLFDMYKIKNCSVILEREDINKYLNLKLEESNVNDMQSNILQESSNEDMQENTVNEDKTIIEQDDIVEETVVNDIQFDMLDVSEDIVIGDNCEVKSIDDKDIVRVEVPVSEEVILDNSQSSCEDIVPTESGHNGNECKTYDYSSDENLRRDAITVTGNADAVLAIECIENNFVAACLDGNVYYFSADGQLLSTLRGSNLAVTCLTIVKEKDGTTVYTGSLDSRIRYYDLETGLEKGPECNVLSPIQTMDRAWDTVFVGTRTGFVLQFECKNNMLIPVSTVKFSEQSILALRAMKEGPRKVLLVAARSENVTIKDAQTGLILRTLAGPKMTVYTLLYEDGKVYCGTSSHQIHVFDYSSGCLVGSHEGGKGAVCLRASGGLLFAGCYDGCVYVYREGESRPMAQLRGPSLMLLSLAVVGSKIIAGYKDRSLYIWKIPLSILQEMIL